MNILLSSNVTSANGINIKPTTWANSDISGLKFANGSSTFISNNVFLSGNTVAVNTSQITLGTSGVNSSASFLTNSKIAIPMLTVGGTITFIGGIMNTQIFTANGTWNNPNNALGLTGNENVFVMMWGGGGQGYNDGGGGFAGGGGGAFVTGMFKVSEVGNTAAVTVGLGAAAAGTTNSIFAASIKTLTAPSGASPTSTSLTGSGGGSLSINNGINGGDPLGGVSNNTSIGGISTFGGGGGGANGGGASIFGGGGGGLGNSIFGGGGGGAAGSLGISIFGGNGANGDVSEAGIPGGGGFGSDVLTGYGGRGEVRVWVLK